MLCSKILVAYDESELALKSLEKAIELTKLDPSIEIQVLHAVTLPIKPYIYGNAFQEIEESMLMYGNEVIKKAEALLSEIPNPSQAFVVEGSAITALLEHAQSQNCDLIIMGSRGLSGFKEFLGSVSHYIVQHSPVPVLLVK
ncbi:universal stress protein [Peribacillus simplex]|uniref:universal stress protein n=1 Tax=Peribacillus simplex TaxID=1478 RepID=UPI00298ECAB8|nr:universal stress protein [Peribacillus simplex]MDW7616058.1 universal stress protein [Peribacillus simplex]